MFTVYQEQNINSNDPIIYLNKKGWQEKSQYFIYLISIEWSVDVITGNSFGDVTPKTYSENLISMIMMVLGAGFTAFLYANFESVITLVRSESIKQKNIYQRAKEFCVEREIQPGIRRKIRRFYTNFPQGYKDKQNYKLIQQLPLSLQTEIALYMNENLVQNAKIFNLGSPNFILATARHLYPKVCIQHDIVIRAGEIATEFFIIKSGKVEIIATDGKTVISLLEEGAYFGEIGLLMNDEKRTVTVRAVTDCLFMCLTKEKFHQIVDLFPDHKSYLQRVGRQRWETTNPEDIPDGLLPYVPYNEIEDNLISRKKPNTKLYFSQFLKQNQQKFSQNNKKKTTDLEDDKNIDIFENEKSFSTMNNIFNQGLSTIIEKLDLWDKYLVIPNFSSFYFIWMYTIFLTVGYNIFYIPFSISFDYDWDILFLQIFDVLTIFIFFFDSFIHSNTIVKDTKSNKWIVNTEILHNIYINKNLLLDMITFLPWDYFFLLLGVNKVIIRWVRLTRMGKAYRIKCYLHETQQNQEKQHKFTFFSFLTVFFFIFNHLAACIMYSFTQYSASNNQDNLSTFQDEILIEDYKPFLKESVRNLYTHYLYWAFTCSSSGSYGDIRAVSAIEKAFQIWTCLFFRLYVVLLFSEVSNLSTTYKSLFAQHLENVDIITVWSNHINLPKPLRQRLKNFFNYNWYKFKGIDNNSVLQDLPDTIQNEIILSLMQNVAYKVATAYQNDESGALLSLIKMMKLKIIPKDEYVFLKDEIATEMYFIIEGQAKVMIKDKTGKFIDIKPLRKGDYFGEMAILGRKAGKRGGAIKAHTNLFLASLSLQDFNTISKFYPEIYDMIKGLAETRQKQTNQSNNSKDDKKKDKNQQSNAFFRKMQQKIDQVRKGTFSIQKGGPKAFKLQKQQKQLQQQQQQQQQASPQNSSFKSQIVPELIGKRRENHQANPASIHQFQNLLNIPSAPEEFKPSNKKNTIQLKNYVAINQKKKTNIQSSQKLPSSNMLKDSTDLKKSQQEKEKEQEQEKEKQSYQYIPRKSNNVIEFYNNELDFEQIQNSKNSMEKSIQQIKKRQSAVIAEKIKLKKEQYQIKPEQFNQKDFIYENNQSELQNQSPLKMSTSILEIPTLVKNKSSSKKEKNSKRTIDIITSISKPREQIFQQRYFIIYINIFINLFKKKIIFIKFCYIFLNFNIFQKKFYIFFISFTVIYSLSIVKKSEDIQEEKVSPSNNKSQIKNNEYCIMYKKKTQDLISKGEISMRSQNSKSLSFITIDQEHLQKMDSQQKIKLPFKSMFDNNNKNLQQKNNSPYNLMPYQKEKIQVNNSLVDNIQVNQIIEEEYSPKKNQLNNQQQSDFQQQQNEIKVNINKIEENEMQHENQNHERKSNIIENIQQLDNLYGKDKDRKKKISNQLEIEIVQTITGRSQKQSIQSIQSIKNQDLELQQQQNDDKQQNQQQEIITFESSSSSSQSSIQKENSNQSSIKMENQMINSKEKISNEIQKQSKNKTNNSLDKSINLDDSIQKQSKKNQIDDELNNSKKSGSSSSKQSSSNSKKSSSLGLGLSDSFVQMDESLILKHKSDVESFMEISQNIDTWNILENQPHNKDLEFSDISSIECENEEDDSEDSENGDKIMDNEDKILMEKEQKQYEFKYFLDQSVDYFMYLSFDFDIKQYQLESMLDLINDSSFFERQDECYDNMLEEKFKIQNEFYRREGQVLDIIYNEQQLNQQFNMTDWNNFIGDTISEQSNSSQEYIEEQQNYDSYCYCLRIILQNKKLRQLAKIIKTFIYNNFLTFSKGSILIFFIFSFNTIYIPLYLAFPSISYRENNKMIFLEIFFVVVLILFTYFENDKYIQLFKRQKLLNIEEENYHLDKTQEKKQIRQKNLNLLQNILITLPIPLIFDLLDIPDRRTNIFLITVQMIRLTKFYVIYEVLKSIRRKNIAQATIIKIVLSYLFMAHIIACMFIVIGKAEDDWNKAWFAKLPSPQPEFPNLYRDKFPISDFSVYIHALYWSYVTTSHQGVGDVSAVSMRERQYTIVIMLVSTFTNAFFFGNLASMVQQLKPIIKTRFEELYNKVQQVMKNSKLTFQFKIKLENYFNYIWRNSLGINDTHLLSQLPNTLRVEIFEFLYDKTIKKSNFFKIDGKTDQALLVSILRFMKVEIFLPKDMIILAGNMYDKVYVILEGKATVYSFDNQVKRKLKIGDYFGAIRGSQDRQPAYIKAEKLCKLGYLTMDDYQSLGDTFTVWKTNITEYYNDYRFRCLENLDCVLLNKYQKELNIDKLNKQTSPSRKYSHQNQPKNSIQQKEKLFLDEIHNIDRDYVIDEGVVEYYKNYIHEFIISEQDDSDDSVKDNKNSKVGQKFSVSMKQDNAPKKQKNDLKETVLEFKQETEKLQQNIMMRSMNPRKFANAIKFTQAIANNEPQKGESQNRIQGFVRKQQKKSKNNSFQLTSQIQNATQNVPSNFSKQQKQPMNSTKKLNDNLKQSNSNLQQGVNSFKNLLNSKKKLGKQEEQVMQNTFTNLPSNQQLLMANNMDILIEQQSKSSSKNMIIQSSPCKSFTQFIQIYNFTYYFDKKQPNIKYYISQYSKSRVVIDIFNICGLIYTLFSISLIIGFEIKPDAYLIILELVCIMIQFQQILVSLHTPHFLQGELITVKSEIFKIYKQSNQFYWDLYAVLPINLLIWIIEFQFKDHDFFESEIIYIFLVFLRLNRFFVLRLIPSMIQTLENRYRNLQNTISILQSFFILLLVWHIMACLWFLFNLRMISYETRDSYSWMKETQIMEKNTWNRYFYSLFFFMTLASTVGYSEMAVYNDLERVFYIFSIYVGNALLAIGFGLMASQSHLLEEKYHGLFILKRNIQNLLQTYQNIPQGLKDRLEQYFSYLINSKHNDQSQTLTIKGLIPDSLYNELIYLNAKDLLKKFKILNDLNNPIIMRDMATVLEKELFLQNDYIIFKNDIGEEMFFIIDGAVTVLSKNEDKNIVTLNSGYFGEVALFSSNSKRMCSIVAQTLCQLYVLKKHNLEIIFQQYPSLKKEFKKEGDRRIQEFNELNNKNNKDKKQKNSVQKINDNEDGSSQITSSDRESDYYSDNKSDNSKGNKKSNTFTQQQMKERRLKKEQKRQENYMKKKKSTIIQQKNQLMFGKNISEQEAQSQIEIQNEKIESKKDIAFNNLYEAMLEGDKFNLKKVNYLCKTFEEDQTYNNLSDENNASQQELVLDDELQNITDSAEFDDFLGSYKINNDQKKQYKKQSRRNKIKGDKKERRLSRFTLGKELKLNKGSGLKLHWGISVRNPINNKDSNNYLNQEDNLN